MCIAAIIFSPVPFEYLESMDEDNPHGGGVAWEVEREDGTKTIRFKRGLNHKQIWEMQQAGEMNYPYLLHFRWATHGARVPQLTHPFPVGPRALFGELEGDSDEVLIHNGMWSHYGHEVPTWSEFPDELVNLVSDTAIAAWRADSDESVLDQVPWATARAYIGPDGMDIDTRGTWTDWEGNWYSNMSWKPNFITLPDGTRKYTKTWSYYRGYQYSDSGSNNYSKWSYDDWMEWAQNGCGSYGDNERDTAWNKQADAAAESKPDESVGLSGEDAYNHGQITWQEFIAKYGKPAGGDFAPSPKEATEIESLGPEMKGASLSWYEYLEAKYGKKVADEVMQDYGPDPDDNSGDNIEIEMDIDPDLVSEDFETVNAVLARQNRKAA